MAHTALKMTTVFLLLAASVLLIWMFFRLESSPSPVGSPTTTPSSSTPSPTLTPSPYSTPTPAQGPTIQSQPENSLQMVNATSEDPLHVFLGALGEAWERLDGTSEAAVYGSIKWGSPSFSAWDPIGAGLFSEAVIPKGGFLILRIPSDMQGHAFRVTPLKLKNNDYSQIDSSAAARAKVMQQWPILLEGGPDVVTDSSAVDGINFKMKYELTSNGTIKTMEVHRNPCQTLSSKYLLDVGCRNPSKVDCASQPSCDCKPNSQNCKFNECSRILFDIPQTLERYFNEFDTGNVVKAFINQSSHLKSGSSLRNYCEDLQNNSGDFTSYCYDYNDISSSPWLNSPHKMKVTYQDLMT